MSPELAPPLGNSPPIQLFRLLLIVSNHLRTRMDARLAPTGLTTQQAAVLTIVQQVEPHPTLGMLAEMMGTSHQNVRQIVAALERKGYASVTVDPADRRVRRIAATPGVDQVFAPRDAEDHAEVATWFAALSASEQELAVSLLARLFRHLDGASATGGET